MIIISSSNFYLFFQFKHGTMIRTHAQLLCRIAKANFYLFLFLSADDSASQIGLRMPLRGSVLSLRNAARKDEVCSAA
jgi:hypothetical protein